jgi:hypothetical protein
MIQRGHEARFLADDVVPRFDSAPLDERQDPVLQVAHQLLSNRQAVLLRDLVSDGHGQEDLVHRAARTRHGMAITCMSGASDEVSTTGSSSP